MTYKPDEALEVVFNGEAPGWLAGTCEMTGVRDSRFAPCRGQDRGYVYVLGGGRWVHTRCYHRSQGFPKEAA